MTTFFGNRIGFDDTPALDAFGRLRVSQPNTSFDAQQEYGLDTRTTWDASANGNLAAASSNGSIANAGTSVGPTDANTRMTPIVVSATNGNVAILQSKQYVRYIPGKSHLIYVTGVFAAGGSYSASIVLRSSTSGAPADTAVAQASWSVDPFDGTGPSGITLDLTKVQILWIDAQMLYSGRVTVGFIIDGLLYQAHNFDIANVIAVPSVQTFNLPVRAEGRTGASTSTFRFGYFDSANGVFVQTVRNVTGGTAQFTCCSVQSEGGEEARGFSWTANNGVTPVLVTTRQPLLSIRPKATFNSRTNRAHIEPIEAIIRATTNDALIELVLGGTLTGAAFASLHADSVTEFDTAATVIAGGTAIRSTFAISGSGANSLEISAGIDLRNPLVLSKIDALAATQTILSVVATSQAAVSHLEAVLNWHEQTI